MIANFFQILTKKNPKNGQNIVRSWVQMIFSNYLVSTGPNWFFGFVMTPIDIISPKNIGLGQNLAKNWPKKSQFWVQNSKFQTSKFWLGHTVYLGLVMTQIDIISQKNIGLGQNLAKNDQKWAKKKPILRSKFKISKFWLGQTVYLGLVMTQTDIISPKKLYLGVITYNKIWFWS